MPDEDSGKGVEPLQKLIASLVSVSLSSIIILKGQCHKHRTRILRIYLAILSIVGHKLSALRIIFIFVDMEEEVSLSFSEMYVNVSRVNSKAVTLFL